MARCRAVILAYLPNKKILFLVVFILLIFAGWFYFSDYKNKQVQYIADKEKSPLAVALDTTSQLDADGDSDGLKDWEELLWKTDSNKADTDGDGTNDNEEITLNRNPLKAGPDDKISDKEDLVAREKAASDSKQNTLTAAYARQFLTEYLLIKQQKGELSEEDKNNLVESLAIEIEKKFKTKDFYNISNIKIVDNQKTNLEKYSQEIKRILVDDRQIKENELIIFDRLLENIKNKEFVDSYGIDAKKLLDIADIYSIAVERIASIGAPDILAKNHLLVINSLFNVREEVEMMASVVNDPIKGLVGVRLYKQDIENFSTAFDDLKNDLEEKNIFIAED